MKTVPTAKLVEQIYKSAYGKTKIEIIPVLFDGGRPMVSSLSPLTSEAKGIVDPTDTAKQLAKDIGLNIDNGIFHSTSWRYEDNTVTFTFFFLGVDPKDFSSELDMQPIEEDIKVAEGGTVDPEPASLSIENIVAHGLEHMAILSDRDESIKEKMRSKAWLSARRWLDNNVSEFRKNK